MKKRIVRNKKLYFTAFFIAGMICFNTFSSFFKIPDVAALITTYISGNTAIITNIKSKKIKQTSVASNHGCSLAIDQYVYCAGLNTSGQLGDTTINNRSSPVSFKLPDGQGATSISTVHNGFTCAVTTEQLAYCSGTNNDGQLGDNSTINRSTPVLFQTPAGAHITKIIPSVYHFYTCALTADQAVYCAGNNDVGQLGNPPALTDRLVPVPFLIPVGQKAMDVAVGRDSTCVLTITQLIHCAGYNINGGLGDGSNTNRSSPVPFQTPAGKIPIVVDVAHGHTCILTGDQLVYCSGLNTSGQLGNTFFASTTLPTLPFVLPGGKKVASLEANKDQTCVVTTDKMVYCAGLNSDKQLGNGGGANTATPAPFVLPIGKLAQTVSSTYLHTCVLTTDQMVYCAGDNTYGQLGNNASGTDIATPEPFQLPAGKKAVSVSTSYYQTCVLTADQQTFCAGNNTYGQLGDKIPQAIKPDPAMFMLP